MLEKLKFAWETFHPRSFTVSLRKQYPDVYKWAAEQPLPVEVCTFTNRVFVLLNPVQPKCENTKCNNVVINISRHGWGNYCSAACKGKHNSLKSRDKAKSTSLINWGVDNPTRHTDVREKMTNTMVKNHGVRYAKQSVIILAKTSATMLERFGVEYAAQSPDIQTKTKADWLEKFGVDNPSKRHISVDTFEKLDNPAWLTEQNKTHTLSDIADTLQISYPTVSNAFKKHGLTPIRHNILVSDAEREIVNFIKSNSNTVIIESDRSILNPFELDIYLPELSIAIEFNGNYWHSDSNGKDRNYHLNKTIQCADKGIHLIHIWEYIYNQKKDIVLSKINNLLGNSMSVYGRKCSIEEIDTDTAKTFLDSTHIQGYCAAATKIGLFHNNELVAVMTFGIARFDKKHEYELLRYSSKLNTSVVGGFSKLLKYFVTRFAPTSVVSYSDLTWSMGKVYSKNGFSLKHRAKPSYYYTNDYVNFEHRMAFQKKKMKTKLTVFDPTKSEWENMQNNGYDRIWNCGNDVWVWTAI